jgi:hypothetical protein
MTDKFVLVEQGILDDGQPIRAISWREPEDSNDSGFAAWSSPPDTTGDCELIHLRCFIDEHPEAGEGMDLAKQHGEATRTEGGWVSAGAPHEQPHLASSL